MKANLSNKFELIKGKTARVWMLDIDGDRLQGSRIEAKA